MLNETDPVQTHNFRPYF